MAVKHKKDIYAESRTGRAESGKAVQNWEKLYAEWDIKGNLSAWMFSSEGKG
jgi:hypothetical protein